MTEAEIGWLAGLLEGEGSIVFTGKNGVSVVIGMTDKDVIERIQKVSGIGSIYPTQGTTRSRILYQWQVANKQDATYLLETVRPWMGERRSIKITGALERLEKNKGINRQIQHGTRNGYKQELYKGLEPCQECRKANSEYQKGRVYGA